LGGDLGLVVGRLPYVAEIDLPDVFGLLLVCAAALAECHALRGWDVQQSGWRSVPVLEGGQW
jgi:hypothetical protein